MLHASPCCHFIDLRHRCCSDKRRGGTVAWTNPEEDLLHANADAAPQKEICDCDEEEVADTDAKLVTVAFDILEEKEGFTCAGRITIGHANENKSFTYAVADFVTASKKETFPDSGTIRVGRRIDVSKRKSVSGSEWSS
jgi:hypothetical protein